MIFALLYAEHATVGFISPWAGVTLSTICRLNTWSGLLVFAGLSSEGCSGGAAIPPSPHVLFSGRIRSVIINFMRFLPEHRSLLSLLADIYGYLFIFYLAFDVRVLMKPHYCIPVGKKRSHWIRKQLFEAAVCHCLKDTWKILSTNVMVI